MQTASNLPFFRVFFVNFGYALDESFPTFETALAAAKKAGLEASIQEVPGNVIAGWSPLYGTRMIR